MSDCFHLFGNDLVVGADGDVMLASNDKETLQRVLRRILTSPATPNLPADYIWEPTYGAGARRMIGQALTPQQIVGRIQTQLFFETGVAQKPAPTITVTPQTNGVFNVSIQYYDANSGAPMLLDFDVLNP